MIVAIVLGSILVLLLVAFLFTSLVVLKTKRLLCFKRNAYQRPFLHSDKELQRRKKGPKKSTRVPFSKRDTKSGSPAKGRKSKHYQSIGRAVKFPMRDPFANKLLENPMVSMDDFDMDWTNPAFDETRALKFDATVAIQSWYRMVR